jgi:hypothetical protein
MKNCAHPVVIARAEALFASGVPTGEPLTRAQLNDVVAAAVLARGGVQACAAEMAAAFGERPESAPARMRWALRAVEARHGRRT